MHKSKIYTITKKITCTDNFQCSDSMIEKLQPLNLKLKATKSTDIVNGSITIDHTPNKHMIIIEIYQEDKKPEGMRATTLEKPSKTPTETEIKQLLKSGI